MADASSTPVAGGTVATTPAGALSQGDVDSIGNQALQAKNRRIKVCGLSRNSPRRPTTHLSLATPPSQAEQDRQLLQNRINRLIVEEEKAAKRIAETRRRAKEIWELKRRNEASQATRQDAGAWMSAEQELQKELMRAARSERQAGIQASRGAMAHMRREEVKVLRQMRHENEGAVQAQRAFEHGRAVQRKAMVKEQQRLAAERKAKEREAALTRLKAEREAKQSLLGKDASDQVRDFERMQEEERRLIASLQATQAQQQAAYSQLEGVLGSAQASRVR